MKIILLILLTLSIQAKVLNFEFQSGNNHYQSTTISTTLSDKYKTDYKTMKIILLEAPSRKNEMQMEQSKILRDLPHFTFEDTLTIWVMSLTNETYQVGYHTTMTEAKKLAKNHKNFKITILDSNGKIIKQSSTVMSSAEIIQALE